MIAVTACNNRETVPFPSEVTEFALPVTKPLKFTEPKKIDWVTTISDSGKAPETKRLDFTKLPSRPFYLEGFQPLHRPMEEQSFDIASLPDTTINFDNIPATHLRIKTSIIQPPVVVKAGLPRLKKNADAGIFEFGEDQNLPGGFVSTLMQDSHGMMWIMTDKGLCRFNGEYLEIYSFVETIFTGELASASKLIEDKQGRIWIKTDISGIYIFDPKAGIVSNINMPIDIVQLRNDNEMILDSRGLIWIGSSIAGVYIIDRKNQTLRHLKNLRELDNGRTEKLLEDNDGNIWVGSNSGLGIINYTSGKIHFATRANGLLSDTISGLNMDAEKRIWIGTAGGVNIINSSKKNIRRLGKVQGIDRTVNHFTEDYKQRMWMASDSGVYVFENATQKLRLITAATGLFNNNIRTIVKDSKEQVWIDTYTGINIIDAKGIMPDYYSESNGLSGTDIWSILDDGSKRIWIGSRSGVDIYSPNTNSIMRLGKDLLLRKWPTISYLLRQTTDGKIVIAAPASGFEIIDTSTGVITYFTKDQGVKNLGMPTMMIDDSGRIWTGNFDGAIEIFDPGKKSSTIINHKNGLIGGIVWELMQDKKGNVWAGTDSGVNIINLKNRTIRYLKDGENISKENTGSFLIDDEERVWIGSRTKITIVDEKKRVLTTVTTANGMAAPDVYTLYKYKQQVYAGTGNGLTVFTPADKKSSAAENQFPWSINSYDKNQGLLYTNFNAGAAMGSGDKLWWGIEDKALTITDIPKTDTGFSSTLISGIVIADKLQNFTDNKWIQHSLPTNDTVWTVTKDTFYLRDRLPADTNWLQKNKIVWAGLSGYFNLPVDLTLPYNQNYISFRFTGSQLSNRDKTRYRYILEGVDKSWSAITNNPFSENYRDIPAGKYTFKVSSKGFNGKWSEPAEFSFTILPPWWNTWWAYLLYLAGFSLIVWVLVQYRSRRLKQENLHLEEVVTLRTKELSQSLNDLKNTQTQLVQSEKMASLGELTAGIAHEIQNPLNFVNNFSEVNKELIDELKEERKKDQRDLQGEEEILKALENNLEKITHHGKRADAIVKGMLQHSRKSTGQKEPTDINALADEFLRLSYHGLRAKDKLFNAALHTDFDKSIGNVNIIPQDIGRVLLNLFNNAFYAVSEKKQQSQQGYEPTVSIITKRNVDTVVITVKDNGNGIPSSVTDKIFQPFFTTKPTGEGTGLGLSLSYDIITKGHGGDLKVESKEGEGAAFIISLPLK